MNTTVRSARSADGKTIHVGDSVRMRIVGKLDDNGLGPVVTVQCLHRQGADGTIVTTSPAPDPDFPHHDSGRASRFHLVSKKPFNNE